MNHNGKLAWVLNSVNRGINRLENNGEMKNYGTAGGSRIAKYDVPNDL